MDLMISELTSRLIPAATHAEAPDILYYATGSCALGQVLVARSAKGVCAILIGNGQGELEATSLPDFPTPSWSRTRPSFGLIWRRSARFSPLASPRAAAGACAANLVARPYPATAWCAAIAIWAATAGASSASVK